MRTTLFERKDSAYERQRRINGVTPIHDLGRVDNDTIRVIDPESHAVDVTFPVSRITATPLSYEARDAESGHVSKTHALRMSVPGVPPLTFGCPHLERWERRFSWCGTVRIVERPSDVHTLSRRLADARREIRLGRGSRRRREKGLTPLAHELPWRNGQHTRPHRPPLEEPGRVHRAVLHRDRDLPFRSRHRLGSGCDRRQRDGGFARAVLLRVLRRLRLGLVIGGPQIAHPRRRGTPAGGRSCWSAPSDG